MTGLQEIEDGATSCCTTRATTIPAIDEARRKELIRRAFTLEYVTIGWMLIEVVVAITSGLRAHSTSLLAFGIDSMIELVSAGVLIWRLGVELRHGLTFGERAERIAGRIAGALLFALGFYVVIAAVLKLASGTGEAFSWPGFVVTAAAMPVMYMLARRKIAVADALGSRALRADAVESITCGYLSLVVVIGLIATVTTGAWWVDGVASLFIVWFVLKEGREAWRGECCCE